MHDSSPWPVPPALSGVRQSARIKHTPEDFRVIELPNWTPSGDGEHEVLWIQKTDANTEWVARQLARYAEVSVKNVSFAGRKDRAAVTDQWFSVQVPGRSVDWSDFSVAGVQIQSTARHNRKIRAGALRGNRFEVRLREMGNAPDPELIVAIAQGVPNYFGAQRFGRGFSNLDAAEGLANGRRLRRNERSLALSAARAAIFNSVLAIRVQAQTWDTPLDGDVVQLEGSNSVFAVESDALDDVKRRAEQRDLHPTGPLYGRGDTGVQSDAMQLEAKVIEDCAKWASAAERGGAKAGRRSLRVVPKDFSCEYTNETAHLTFELPAGSFATALLNELVLPD
ncbi:MAG: tRNA pseudouridine(13) synthase TruD [Pseudomonadota bacterium]